MSTTALASKDGKPSEQAEPGEEKTFDPRHFPDDPLAGQRELAQTYADLHALQERLPWSREPHPGWPEETERGREHAGRAASPGWDPGDAEAFDRMMGRLRELAGFVQGHPHWAECQAHGADMVAARQALKHATGAVPGHGD
ncbi:hypothetical protein ACFZA1_42145 [Streptomyces filipinensis]|uniref:hypothetical protein n=1 Tax=Streptomyces filipinensis TaxID=66887 RepID=UPI0036F058E4